MPQKLTIEYVRDFVENGTNGLCQVLDDKYVNDHTPMRIRCKCGTDFTRDFHHIKRGQFYCSVCKQSEMSRKNRKSMEQVIAEIEQTGCSYVSGDYTNNKSELTIRCRCGNLFQKKAIKFFSGQDRCPQCGKKRLISSKKKYSCADVQSIIAKDGYKIIDEKNYKDSAHKVRCICSQGHEFDLVFGNYLCGKSGCKICANAAMSGSKHWNFQGGKSEVVDSLRKAIKPWKVKIKNAYNGKCAVTGEAPKRLDVHHLCDFLDIIDKCTEETGTKLARNLSDYSDYSEYEALKNAVVGKHTMDIGIPISHSIHAKFHKQYAGKRTTREQFNSFLMENYGVTLNEIMK